jgi:hypothetical protein
MADRRPVPYQGQPPAQRGQGRLPVSAPGPVPTHRPQSLDFRDLTGTREELWERIPASVRQKVDARYGQLLEWWAADDEQGRVTAVVLGDQALVTAEPTINANGDAAYRVAGLSLDPSSFRSVTVTGPSSGPGADHDTAATPTRGPGAGPQPTARIERELAGFLGYLPARAQTLLQEPFLTGTEPLDWRYHYLRHGVERGLSSANLQVWCYLTDMRTMTFVAGTGHGYRDGAGADSWQLSCWRATRR